MGVGVVLLNVKLLNWNPVKFLMTLVPDFGSLGVFKRGSDDVNVSEF